MPMLHDLSNHLAFIRRHIGPSDNDQTLMLETCQASSIDELIKETVPESILLEKPIDLQPAQDESSALKSMRAIAEKNQLMQNHIGMGYYPVETPNGF